jgi:L-threonylcarbamoyladenylate synthase
VPQHEIAQALIAATGRPIAAPSANKSGHVSPVTAAHVLEDLDGCIDLILDGGPTQIGLESTIVSCLGDEVRILRPGGLARSAIEHVLGFPLRAHAPDDTTPTAPRAPGLLASHYAPRARLRLGATELHEAEAGLDFGGALGAGLLDLSPRRDLLEAAANLFAYLRRLDASGATCIAVAPIPFDGLGEAINDRLARAAAPRG